VAEKINQMKQPIKKLRVSIEANWWFTQIDSDSRHEIGEEAEVDNKWYQVS